MPVKDPYWLVRSRAFLLEIPLFGEKYLLQQNIEILLFNLNNNSNKLSESIEKYIPSISESKIKSSLDLFERKYGRKDEDININGNIIIFTSM
jgi:hypothetical protein